MNASRILRRSLSTALVACALAAPSAGATQLLYATTSTDHLVSFTAQAPAKLLSDVPLQGLIANEHVVGMDMRPATGEFLAYTSAARVIGISVSGHVREIRANVVVNGSMFGVDVAPQGDKLRIVSNTDANVRLDTTTGAITDNDGKLNYAPNDSGSNADPNVVAVAYTNSAFGSTPNQQTEYGIDTARNALVTFSLPFKGELRTVGALAVEAADDASLDVGDDGVLYAAFTGGSTTVSNALRLWTISPTSGAATPSTFWESRLTVPVTSLAAVGTVPNDTVPAHVAIGNYTTYRSIWLSRGLKYVNACDEGCSTTTVLRIGSTVAGTATASMPTAGARPPKIVLTAAGRRAAARPGRISASLTITSRDLAGNKNVQVARFVSVP